MFIMGRFSCWLKDLAEMSKKEFEDKYKNSFDVKLGWIELQKRLKEQVIKKPVKK